MGLALMLEQGALEVSPTKTNDANKRDEGIDDIIMKTCLRMQHVPRNSTLGEYNKIRSNTEVFAQRTRQRHLGRMIGGNLTFGDEERKAQGLIMLMESKLDDYT